MNYFPLYTPEIVVITVIFEVMLTANCTLSLHFAASFAHAAVNVALMASNNNAAAVAAAVV